MRLLLIAALGTIILSCHAYADPNGTIFILERFPISIETGDYLLETGCVGELGFPIESFMNIYLTLYGSIVKQVKTIDDLRGIVVVRSESDAMELLSLFRSPLTNYYFNKNTPNEPINLTIIPDQDKRDYATISRSLALALGLEEPLVVREGEHFIVETNLVKSESLSALREVIRSREKISKDGTHEILWQNTVAYVDPYEIFMPYMKW